MCAIFGFIARQNRPPKLSTLARIVRGNVQRGPHAFGLAWIDSRGRLRMYKQTGRLTDHMGILAMARDAKILVGHLRWATHGDCNNNLNNHPHPADGGWIVHNGIVHNYRALLDARGLMPVSECDSEAIGLLIEQSAGTLAERVSRAVRLMDGALAMLGLWSRPATLVAVRRGNPLHRATTDEGTYLATLGGGLPSRAVEMPDNQTCCFSVRGGEVVCKTNRLPSSRASKPATIRRGVWLDDDAPLYSGG